MIETDKISAHASAFRERIEAPDGFLATCDGGDPGTPSEPSVWLMGLEPGWSTKDEATQDELETETQKREWENYSIDLQLGIPFNQKAFQLLAALEGEAPESYRAFAQRKRTFEKGAKGYLKLNLFSAACNNIDKWEEAHRLETGFESKENYQTWMRSVRFPILRQWIAQCRPKLIICTGLTHLPDFMSITESEPNVPPQYFEIRGHKKRIHLTHTGLAPVAVIPHLTGGANGLNSYEAIAKTAELINAGLNKMRGGKD